MNEYYYTKLLNKTWKNNIWTNICYIKMSSKYNPFKNYEKTSVTASKNLVVNNKDNRVFLPRAYGLIVLMVSLGNFMF